MESSINGKIFKKQQIYYKKIKELKKLTEKINNIIDKL